MRNFDSENHAERLRRRLQERQDRLEKNFRPRLSAFTLVSIAIILILVLLFFVLGDGSDEATGFLQTFTWM